MKNYQAQTPQNLVLTKILQDFGKTSTPLDRDPLNRDPPGQETLWTEPPRTETPLDRDPPCEQNHRQV